MHDLLRGIVCYIRMSACEGARCVKRHPTRFNVRNGDTY